MNILRWVVSGLVVSFFVVIVGMASNGSTFVSQATADDQERELHPDIVKIEGTYSQVKFDLSRKSHLLRKMRMDHYIAQAKQADLRGWDHERKDLIERAENILSHHLTQYAVSVQNDAKSYSVSSI